jgi:hypothetical protein
LKSLKSMLGGFLDSLARASEMPTKVPRNITHLTQNDVYRKIIGVAAYRSAIEREVDCPSVFARRKLRLATREARTILA